MVGESVLDALPEAYGASELGAILHDSIFFLRSSSSSSSSSLCSESAGGEVEREGEV